MKDPLETMQREPAEDDVPEGRRGQAAWNGLRRKQPVEQARVVKQPPVLPMFVKPLKPIGVKR